MEEFLDTFAILDNPDITIERHKKLSQDHRYYVDNDLQGWYILRDHSDYSEEDRVFIEKLKYE